MAGVVFAAAHAPVFLAVVGYARGVAVRGRVPQEEPDAYAVGRLVGGTPRATLAAAAALRARTEHLWREPGIRAADDDVRDGLVRDGLVVGPGVRRRLRWAVAAFVPPTVADGPGRVRVGSSVFLPGARRRTMV
ncbi:hypothetical protein [Actinomadura flavalba]|uniref:hypothetical protein n=1 Tax=Actinomadura flavalba TaxID=1120938 RepID=UPI00037D4C34|nr:hypothetical protein [Actinomadura flavalba]